MSAHRTTNSVARRTLLAATAAGASLLASACSWGAPSAESEDDLAPLLEVSLAEPLCLDPGAAADQGSLQVVYQVFEPLFAYDFAAGALTGCAASDVDVSEDARTFTFHVRDVTFHNGEPVTAASFKRAWERIIDPMSAFAALHGDSPHAWRLSLIAGYDDLRRGSVHDLAGVTCQDDRTLVVELTRPYADFPFVVAHPALSPVPAAAEDDARAFAAEPVGNGPYIMSGTVEADASVVKLEAFASYRLGAPAAHDVRFIVEDDTVASYRAFLTGGSDVCACPVDEVAGAVSRHGRSDDGLTMAEGAHLVQSTLPCCSYLACNTASAPLDEVAVRRALSLAIDREDLCSTVYRGVAQPADGIVAPSVHGYHAATWSYVDCDPERAQELLDEGRPRTEDGNRGLELSLIYHKDGGHQKVMERVAQNLEAIGVTIELEPLDRDEFYARLEAGDYQLARLDALTDQLTQDSILYPLFHSASLVARNYTRFANEDVDRLIDEARSLVDIEERSDRLYEADVRIGELAPAIPLVFPARAWVSSDKVEELVADPLGYLHLGTAQVF